MFLQLHDGPGMASARYPKAANTQLNNWKNPRINKLQMKIYLL